MTVVGTGRPNTGEHRGLSRRPACYAPAVPADIVVPSRSLPQMLQASASPSGDPVALEVFGATTSYPSGGVQVSRAAQALAPRP